VQEEAEAGHEKTVFSFTGPFGKDDGEAGGGRADKLVLRRNGF